MLYFILIISTLRGFIFLFGMPNFPIIFFSFTIFSVGVIIYKSDIMSFIKNPNGLSFFIKIVFLNILLGSLWLLNDMFYADYLGSISTYITYFIIPLSVLTFYQLDSEKLHNTILFVSFIVSLTCIIGFFIMNIFPGPPFGYEVMRIPLTQISPGGETAPISHIGPVYRSHGITGHYHDSGNLLAITCVYLTGYTFFIKNNFKTLLITFISLIGLITTLSAANIVACFFGIFIVSFFKINRDIYKRIVGSSLILFSLFFIIIIFVNPETIYEFFMQFDPSGESINSMKNFGGSSNLANFISLLFGHATYSRISEMASLTEIALVSMMSTFGIILFIPLFIMISYPLYLYFISNKQVRLEMWVPFVAFLTGLITLWHYGSLFRSTTIFIFYAISSMIFKIYLNNYNKSKRFLRFI